MAKLMKEKFRFTVNSLPGDAFSVVRFDGSEGLSRLFELNITLVSKKKEIDLADMVQSAARFAIVREEGDIPFPGIIKYCEQLSSYADHYFYRAVLAPKLWWLTLTQHNQVFLDKSAPEIIKAVLEDGGLTSVDYELRLQRGYDKWEYVCQYGETHYDFLARWLEREGMYYFFEEGPAGGKVVITDTKISHAEMKQGKDAVYAPPSGLESSDKEEVVRSLLCRQQLSPASVKLKDYNYRTPSLDLSGSAKAAEHGRGDVYVYGDHVRTKSEADALAKVRAEQYLCRERQFHGESTTPFLKPGFTFHLSKHFRDSYNQEYLTISMDHRGSQAAYLVSALQIGLSDEDRRMHYENSFTAIPSSVQFRSERNTPRPRFSGVINAKVDAAGSGQYAELDDAGRYKVIMPFDVSGREGGKASAWLRMAQPYAGADRGMHFPLNKGAEVLITFIDGDPDRPIIASAIPNPETQSPVTNVNATMNKISTGSGNVIHLEDKEGSERILLHSAKQESYIRIGAPNDPATADQSWDWSKFFSNNGIAFNTPSWISVKAATANSVILGENSANVGGIDIKTVVGARIDTSLGGRVNILTPKLIDITGGTKYVVGGQKTEAWGTKAKAAAQQSKALGQKVDALGQQTKALGQRVRSQGSSIDALGSGLLGVANKTHAIGSDVKALGQQTKALGQQTKALGQETKALGQQTKALGQQTTALGQETKALGQETKALGQKTETIGQKTEALGQKVETVAQQTKVTVNLIII